MEDKLSDRYRNISGTILVINDLNYLEIGINEIIDLRFFSDDFLKKSRGLREHIALKNLVPDTSDVQAMQLKTSDINNGNQPSYDNDLISKIVTEVNKQAPNNTPAIDMDEMIKKIASEIGKEIANNIKQQTIVVSSNEKEIPTNEYEQNIVNSNIERVQDVLFSKYPTITQSNLSAKENFEDDEDYISDLKNLILGEKNEK